MLQIKHISKQYKTGDLVQDALKDVSLNLRDSEFVSILGPSGSGKTTLLNIIGGLDRYDKGDLVINNVSTKNYKDRDWDSYRNHTIGFVFQSYNLIPHQTVLANVELALTIGGISKSERRKRALDALEEVGLREQAHKKPNQMSGGQMQRVAIARALVNNPDILLADEPTGALDTVTSVQVMELLKKVAKDRLVIMVTHNPELAEEYSTRIVRLKDGEIIDDSDPFIVDTKKLKKPKHKNLGKASMSIGTALSLSFNNLLTKKGRTILTAFAGSIGIIGIALILSLSTGFQNYIDKIQEDTLTSYPLTVMRDTADITSALLSLATAAEDGVEGENVKEQQLINTMFSQIGTNDLTSFDRYLQQNKEEVDEMVSMIRYQYSVTPMIYTIEGETGDITKVNPSPLFAMMSSGSAVSSTMMASSSGASIFYEMSEDQESLKAEYDVLAGEWPDSYDETLLVLMDPNSMSDMLVYGLGIRDDKDLENSISKLMAGEKVENTSKPMEFTYDELMNLPLKLVDQNKLYKYNAEYNVYEDMSDDEAFVEEVYNNSIDLKISGIVCPKENSSSMSLSPGLAYTKALTDYVISQAEKSEIVKKQLADEDVNVFSGKRFDDESDEAGLNFEDMITVDEAALASAFGGNISEETITSMTQSYITQISSMITADTSGAENAFRSTMSKFMTEMLNGYIEANANPMMGGAAIINQADVDKVVNDYMASASVKTALSNLEAQYIVPQDTFAQMYSEMLKGVLQGYIAMAPLPDDSTSAALMSGMVETLVTETMKQDMIATAADPLAIGMTEAVMQKSILTKVGEMTAELMGTMAEAFNVDPDALASAFQFNMSEEELSRLFQSMMSSNVENNAMTNLLALGYQDMDEPTSIAFYFVDFEAKEKFIDFLDAYNEDMEAKDEEKVIKYTDLTGLLMSSVKTIVDSVSYVLIAFVSISLVVSSIMIGIITYISVLERTKEIGVLRAIGASKKNISSIFNAETFIVGLFSGLIGIGVTLACVPVINYIIHSLTNNYDINAVLPVEGATILVILSVILTLIGGLIPSRQAAKKDPVLALRSE